MKKIIIVILTLVLIISVSLIGCNNQKNADYSRAVKAYSAGDYTTAKVLFQQVPDYKDAGDYIKKIAEKAAAEKAAAEKAAAEKAAAEKAAAEKATTNKAATDNAATPTKTYSARPVEGAIVTYIDQSTGQFEFEEQCVYCGAIADYVGTRRADGTTIRVPFVCHSCGEPQDAIIETRQ